jgi:hypothetical protein
MQFSTKFRRFASFFALFLVGFVFTSFGQTTKKNLLKIDIITPLAKTLSIAYEMKLNEKSSFQIGFNYINGNRNISNYDKISGVGAMLEYRLYLSKKRVSPEGFFMGFSARGQQLSYQRTDYTTLYDPINQTYTTTAQSNTNSNVFMGAGISFGGQWIFKDIVNLSIFGGPTYYFGADNAPSTLIMTNGNGYGFTLGCMVGIAF